MEIVLITVCAVLSISSAAFYLRLQKLYLHYSKLEERTQTLQKNTIEKDSKLKLLEEQNSHLTAYKGRFEEAMSMINYLKTENQQEKQKSEMLNRKITESEKAKELFRQQQENLQKEQESWQKEKEKILHQLAIHMIEKNEELIQKNNSIQNELSSKQREEIEKNTQLLHKSFEDIWKNINNLNQTVSENQKAVNLTHNALLNPQGANNISEITLENLLKNSGLKQKSNKDDIGDFILQHSFTDKQENKKIPDAIVFLPNNQILIIDSKSSEHFLHLQQAIEDKDTELEKQIMIKIKESMKRHLESLKKRNYAKSKLEELDLKDTFAANNNYNITTIMFLQTEKMLEIVCRADGNIITKARENNILIVSPVGLVNLLNQSKFIIDRLKQEQNIEEIKKKIKDIIDAIYKMAEKSEMLGKAIKSAANKYNDFMGTFRRTVGYAKKVGDLGIEPDKKNLEANLDNIIVGSDQKIIDYTPAKEENS